MPTEIVDSAVMDSTKELKIIGIPPAFFGLFIWKRSMPCIYVIFTAIEPRRQVNREGSLSLTCQAKFCYMDFRRTTSINYSA